MFTINDDLYTNIISSAMFTLYESNESLFVIANYFTIKVNTGSIRLMFLTIKIKEEDVKIIFESIYFPYCIIPSSLSIMKKERTKKFGVKRWAVTFIIYRKLRHSIDSCLVYKRVTRFVLFDNQEDNLE